MEHSSQYVFYDQSVHKSSSAAPSPCENILGEPMLQPGSVVNVLNHSVVRNLRVIATYREGVHSYRCTAGQGDAVLGVITKLGNPRESLKLQKKNQLSGTAPTYKLGDMVRGIVIRTKKEQDRSIGFGKNSKTGIFVRFPLENSVVLLGPNGQDMPAKHNTYAGLMRSKGFSRII